MLNSPDYRSPANLQKVASTFDERWYVATYWRDLGDLRQAGENPLDFYLRIGGRLGHDPHPLFSELFFRTRNAAIYERLKSSPADFGYLLYCAGSALDALRLRHVANPQQCEGWRALTIRVDRKFIAANYPVDPALHISALDFYLQAPREAAVSPNARFSERYYRALYGDVEREILKGNLISGYQHFLASGMAEGRQSISVEAFEKDLTAFGLTDDPDTTEIKTQLENNIPGVTQAVEFAFLKEFEHLTDPITIKQSGSGGKGFLVFIPYYFPEIFFGGYIAFFDLLRGLKQRHGGNLKLVIVRKVAQPDSLQVNMDRVSKSAPDTAALFSSFHLMPDNRTIEIDGPYGVISFCAETHFLASDAARQLNVTPVFMIQDYEPDYNPAGSLRTFTRSAYDLPHIGVYNSAKLHEYFRDFTDIAPVRAAGYRYVTFENDIKPMPLDFDTFKTRHTAKAKRRLIAYARPEFLGGRNEFATIVLALRQAILLGHIDETAWEFSGIGSVLPRPDIALTGRSKMGFIPKLALEKYEEYVLSGDVGISVLSTPHPGIIHFQMAKFGLATVTYQTPGRSAEWLKAQNGNIVPAPSTIDGLCEAIAKAVQLSADIETRYRNAIEPGPMDNSRNADDAARLLLELMSR